jgi:zinc protease
MNVAIPVGSFCDPPGAEGAMSLLARVIDRGTRTRSAAEIAEELDGRGASLSVTVNRHLLSVLCTCLAADFEPMLRLIGEILAEPSFPDAELATRRKEAVTDIRQDEDNPGVRAVETLRSILYGPDHPYGRRIKGTVESLERISRDTLVGLHQDRIAGRELSAVIVGDIDASRMIDAATSIFGRANELPPAASVPPEPPIPAPARRLVVIPMISKAQVDVAYGFTAIARSDPSYYALTLANHALGQHALGGRLGERIRERQGMAYYVSSFVDANVLKGPLMIRAGVSAANVERTIASIDEEVTRLKREGLTREELEDSRRYLVGAIPRTLETNAGIAQFLQTAEFFGLGPDYDRRLPDLLGQVSLEDANAVASRILDPDHAAVVAAGPFEGPPAV